MGRMHGAGRFLAPPSGFGSGVQTGRGSDLHDLYEEDVWAAFPEVSHHHLSDDVVVAVDDDDDRWHDTSVASDIRWVHSKVGGLSLALEDSYRGTDARPLRKRRQPTFPESAPVDVPTWTKQYHLPGSGGPPWETEEEETEGDWMPPHEYLARAHGRSAATASVLEGAGRTLKGRDMSRVRDAVWSQTGFFG